MQSINQQNQAAVVGSDERSDTTVFARFGKIISIEGANNSIRVDFDGNPYGMPISARLGRGFSKPELQLAIDNQFTCRIEFVGGDISLPIITDVFFSLLDQQEQLVIKAKSIVMEAEQELIVKSGETSTRYSGRDGRVTTNAKYVTTQAEKAQIIRGSTVSIN